MKRIFTMAAMMLLATLAGAQITHTSGGNVDKNAQAVLNKAKQKIESGAVSFTVKMVNKNQDKKVTASETAEVIYNKGKYRVSFAGNVIYCDGSATWHWNQETDEVVVNAMSASEDDLMNPAAIIANHNKNFNAKYIRQEADGNAIVDMTPKKSKSYYKIRLVVNANSGVPRRMEMHNYDSSSGEYQISNFKSQVKCSDDDFRFDKSKHPGVEIIDMR